MRFGKRLAEVTRGRGANEPYVSYKDLKHTVSKLSSLIGDVGGCATDEDDGASSAEEGAFMPTGHLSVAAAAIAPPAAPAAAAIGTDPAGTGPALAGITGAPGACGSSAATGGGGRPALGKASRLEAHQQEFFRRIDADVEQAKAYVQSSVSALEAQIGDWQASAIAAGILFTPNQTDEILAQLPFQIDDQQILVEWLMGLQPPESKQAARLGLLDKYTAFASSLNGLLQYIEVNLTAIRKIFKKFEKKVPADMRIQNVRDYKGHHDLYMPAMQHILITSVNIQRLVCGLVAPSSNSSASSPDAAAVVPISQIGPESVALLSWLRGPTGLEDVLGGGSKAPIDVYAKPGAEVGSAGVGTATVGAAAASASAIAGLPRRLGLPGAALPEAGLGYPTGETALQHPAAAFGAFVQSHGASATAPALGPAAIALAGIGAAGALGGGRARGGPGTAGALGPGGHAAPGEAAQPPGQEQEALKGGRRRGGRGSRGGGRGRRTGGGVQPGQGGAAMGGRAQGHEAAGDEGAAALQAGGGGGMARAPGMGFGPMGPAVPQRFFAHFPVYAGKAGGCRGGQAAMVGRGAGCGGRGGFGGKGIGTMGGHSYGDGSGAGQGMVPSIDPNWLAAMMPMFWPNTGGMLPMDGMSQQGAAG